MSLLRATALAFLVACATVPHDPGQACRGLGTTIVVDTSTHELTLCESGVPVRTFAISLGRGGTEKHVQGDLRTPLGVYALGEPRASKQFGTFIPVGYPTAAQVAHGFTGSAVGIHGPDRRFAWAGSLTTAIDWTQGCVAVPSDDEIDVIARWVRARRPSSVVLR